MGMSKDAKICLDIEDLVWGSASVEYHQQRWLGIQIGRRWGLKSQSH